jgi:Uma2 family endonuclease
MAQSVVRKITLSEYLTHEDDTDNSYELVDGELVMVPLPSAEHGDLIDFFLRIFRTEIDRLSLPWKATDKAGVYIGRSQATGNDYSRTPDTCVVLQSDWMAIKGTRGAAVLKTPPILVIEIVSSNWEVDYIDKLAEYQQVGIPEYWIVDYLAIGHRDLIGSSKQPTVSVCRLVEGRYQIDRFRDRASIISPAFPELSLTVEEVVQAARG